jgi:Protein of unknown function (DUF3575)
MYKTILVTLIGLGTLDSLAQAESNQVHIALKISALALYNINTPCFQPGVEVRFLPNWSAQFEYGIQAYKLITYEFNKERHDWKYHRIKAELRHYLTSPKSKRLFLGFEYFMVEQKYAKLNGRLYLSNGSAVEYSRSDIDRISWGLMGKLGFRFWKKNRFWGETVSGLGYKKLSIRHELHDPVLTLYPSIREFSFGRDLEAADWHTLHISVEIKFGYLLFLKQNKTHG